jgi:tetratricopeptide (TPR) repeat protein
VKRAICALVALALAGCGTPLAAGERLYRGGDHLGALETWRTIPEDDATRAKAEQRIAVVEEEFEQLVVRYKQRARYFEDKGRLAESVINYRLALKLQPDDADTLAHVQDLARLVASRRRELRTQYRADFAAGDLAKAGETLDRLRTLDPFDPELSFDERQLGDGLRSAVTRLLATGRRGFSDGNHAAAERSFREVLILDANNESARGYLSYIETIRRESQHAGTQPAAFDPPQTYASDDEIRAEGFYQNALTADFAGDPYEAINHDLRALGADQDHRGARQHLAVIRRKLAGRVDALIEEGRTHFRNEDLQSALDSWRRALLVDPKNERAQAYAARAERQLGNLERLRAEPDVSGGVR